MTHQELWNTIEILAQKNGTTCCGLARMSGLAPTTFNKSKLFSANGVPRWPSCGTIAKVIAATHITIVQFAELCMEQE